MNNTELIMLQALPLDIKVLKTKARLFDAIRKFGCEGLYLSFSGGKDSTVLHHICLEFELELYGEMKIPRVFADTGLEYPEVKEMTKKLRDIYGEDLIITIKPDEVFTKVIEKYGYPIISKEQSQYIYQYRRTGSEKVKLIRWSGNDWGRGKISEKWKYLLETNIPISDKCCEVMKKRPFKKYEKLTNRVPILGKLACESSLRKMSYIKQGGCNAFEGIRPKSEPIGFWGEQDILNYIRNNGIEIATVYGEILVNKDRELYLSGCSRTGCIFCLYGINLEKGQNRLQRLEKTHPKLHDYCIRGGQVGKDGYWIPKNGLGMKRVLDLLKVKYTNK